MSNRQRYTRQNIITNAYYQLPKFLFDEEFSQLSNDARVLYALLRNRHEISIKNGWYDANDEVFLYFKREDMQALLGLSERTVAKAMKDLKADGLLEETKQGLGKPNMIYLLAAVGALHGIGESPETRQTSQTRKFYGSGTVDFTGQEPQILRPNHKEISHKDIIYNPVPSSQSEPKPYGQDTTDATTHFDITVEMLDFYTDLVKSNIGYDYLMDSMPHDMGLVDEFVAIIIDTLYTVGQTIRIGGEDKPRALVHSQLLKLDQEDRLKRNLSPR